MKQRNGVLGLDTAKEVMITFLVLAVIGISVLLALSSLQSASSGVIDTRTNLVTVLNEKGFASPVSANASGYTLSGFNSTWSGITVSAVMNSSSYGAGDGGFNITVPTNNVTVSALGIMTNSSSAFSYDNVSVNYTYTHTYSAGITNNIIGNVSGGVVTFFGSTGTIFSILVVVVIILAISIIIWAVGRFGNQAEGLGMETGGVNL